MDTRLRRLWRRATEEPIYSNQIAFVKTAVRSGDLDSLFLALQIGTPSQLLPNGNLLIRIVRAPSKRKATRIDFQSRTFFIVTPRFQVFQIGDTFLPVVPEYPAQLTDAELQEEFQNEVNRIMDLWTGAAPGAAFIEETEPFEILAAYGANSEFSFPTFEVVDNLPRLSPHAITQAFLSNNISLIESTNRYLNKDYAEYQHPGQVRASIPLSMQYGTDIYTLTVRSKGEMVTNIIPEYFQKLTLTSSIANVPIKKEFLNEIEGMSSFIVDRRIDYDYLTLINKGWQATIPITGGPRPPRIWIRDRIYNELDPDQHPFDVVVHWPLSWPLTHVLGTLRTIRNLEEPSEEEIAAAKAIISNQVFQIIDKLAVDCGWEPEEYGDLSIKDISVTRDFETESIYNAPIPCWPCYQLVIETNSGIEFYTHTNAVCEDMDTTGILMPNIWLVELARQIDLTQPQYWVGSMPEYW